jgi:glycerate kinase
MTVFYGPCFSKQVISYFPSVKIVIASDKFKGSMTSEEVNATVAKAVHTIMPKARIIELPMADGGDGFAPAIKHYLHTKTVRVRTKDPLGRSLTAAYEWDARRQTAIIEMAAASGLALLKASERNPMKTSSFGTGWLIRHAIKQAARTIILGVGGSATNDGGMGLAIALGFRFYDEAGRTLEGNGAALAAVRAIRPPSRLSRVKFIIAADVDNLLCGKDGAAFVYGPQKGANKNMVQQLDKGLFNLADCFRDLTGKDSRNIKGSGAAGGVALPLLTCFSTRIEPGAAILARVAKLSQHLRNADFFISGEGRIDAQSGQGKLVGRLLEIIKKSKVPVLLVCGNCASPRELPRSIRSIPIVKLLGGPVSTATAMRNPAGILYKKLLQSLPSLLQ